MSGPDQRLKLAHEQDFDIGPMRVRPSVCRVLAGASEIRVEAQTMSVLVVLARANGAVVTRDDLVNACWQGRIVSDDAVGRAIAKVRALARGVTPAAFTVETVPKVGYRLVGAGEQVAPIAPAVVGQRLPRWLPAAVAAAALLILAPIAWTSLQASPAPPAPWNPGAPSAPAVADALLNLDEARLTHYLQQGWSPNWMTDPEGSTALHTLMLACERDPTHDKTRLVEVARMLVAAGADPHAENTWGDTPLEIAAARRYCGPNHPVVAYLRSLS